MNEEKSMVGWSSAHPPALPPLHPVTTSFSSRQLMAPEPLEKLGFRDLMEGKPEAKDEC